VNVNNPPQKVKIWDGKDQLDISPSGSAKVDAQEVVDAINRLSDLLIGFSGQEPAREFGNLDKIKSSVSNLDIALSAVRSAIVAVGTKSDTWITDGSRVTQPISAVSLPRPIESASEITLGQILELTQYQEDHLKRIAMATTPASLPAQPPQYTTIGTTSALALSASASRRGLVMCNTSSAYISLAFGAAAVLYSGITLPPYGAWSMDQFSFWTGEIYAIASLASSNLSIQCFC
jgi:hypothetical protein